MARDEGLQKRGNDPCPLIVSTEGRNNVPDCRHPQSSNWTIRARVHLFTQIHSQYCGIPIFLSPSAPLPRQMKANRPDLCSPREKCLSKPVCLPSLACLTQMPWASEHKARTFQKMTRPDSNSKLSLSIIFLPSATVWNQVSSPGCH